MFGAAYVITTPKKLLLELATSGAAVAEPIDPQRDAPPQAPDLPDTPALFSGSGRLMNILCCVRLLVVFVWLFLAARVGQSAPDAAFHPGDRWAAVGDSITHSGSYHAWVYLYYLTRFPTQELELINCGIAGDTTAGALRRFAWDIQPVKPSVATVMFGMNDVGRTLYADNATGADVAQKRRGALEAYRTNLRALVGALQQHGARVVLLTPSLFDETAVLPAAKLTGVNDALGELSRFVHELAGESGAAVVDFHGPMTRLNPELQRDNPAFTLTSADRIHPGAPGHLVMAYLFLKAQNAPAEVARATVDAKTTQVVQASNGTVGDVRAIEGGVAFTWSARALPFPTDDAYAAALAWVPFTAELNRETLAVLALPKGRYVLRIDGIEVGHYSDEDLARGVNLAENTRTPQHAQARDVLRFVKEHRHHVAETARNIALVEHQCAPAEQQPYTLETIRAHYDARLVQLLKSQPPTSNLLRIYKLYPQIKPRVADHRAKAEQLANAARAAAQPKPRSYEIVRTR